MFLETLLALAGDGLGILSTTMGIVDRMRGNRPEPPIVQLNVYRSADGHVDLWGEIRNRGQTSLRLVELRLARPWRGAMVRLRAGQPAGEPARAVRLDHLMIGPGQGFDFDLRLVPLIGQRVRRLVLAFTGEQQEPRPCRHTVRIHRAVPAHG